jgi:signal transduction histidine kinase/ligand-binding sensor domain-containing protein
MLRHKAIALIVPAVLLCGASALMAQPEPLPRFRVLSVEQGLSQSAVSSIVQDNRGFLWFGTQDGLNRYDGHAYRVYRRTPGDTTSPSDNTITCLVVDRSGDLWFGTYAGGVHRLDHSTQKCERHMAIADDSTTVSGNSIMCLAVDSTGAVWAGTWARGLSRFDPVARTWQRFRHSAADPHSLANDYVMTLLCDAGNRLWIGTWGGVDRRDSHIAETPGIALAQNRFTHIAPVPVQGRIIVDLRITSSCTDGRDTFWFGTFEGGILACSGEAGHVERLRDGQGRIPQFPSNRIRSLFWDPTGTLWIGTQDAGIILFHPRSGDVSALERGDRSELSSNTILALYRDRTGGIWVGTDGGGVNHYDPFRFKFLHVRHVPGDDRSLSSAQVRAVCEDAPGRVWVGLLGTGVDCVDIESGEIRHYRHTSGSHPVLSSDGVLTMVNDRHGRLWIGTDGSGIDRFDPVRGSVKNVRIARDSPEAIGPDYLMVLLEARDGSIWAGTMGGGLAHLDENGKTLGRWVNRAGGGLGQLSGNHIYALLEDRAGRIWVGTWGAGISVLDPRTGSVHTYRNMPSDPRSLSHNTVLSFFQDARGTMWIGTAGGGLDACDSISEGFDHWTEQQGLPNDVVYGVLSDDSGGLWLSTNRGVCRFDTAARTFTTYDLSDGLQSLEFNQGAYHRGASGRFYFGGINGLSVFRPDRLARDTVPPPVLITQCRVFDDPFPLPFDNKPLILTYAQNFFSFEFAALDFTNPDKNAYRYILEGFDQEWISSGTRNYASYTNLPAGAYTFKVQGSNGDGVWNRAGAVLPIRVTPAFWETLWFRTLVFGLLLGIGFAYYLGRMRRLEREKTLQTTLSRTLNEFQETERRRIAGELHDSLGQNLLTIQNAVSRLGGTASTDSENLRRETGELTDIVQQTIEDVREISADLHPHMLDRLGLTTTIEATVRKCAKSAGMRIEAHVEDVDRIFSPVEEINLFRIVQEALNNVVKHSGASECTVTIRKTPPVCEIRVEDDGCGFTVAPDGTAASGQSGFGMISMAERVRLLNGHMTITSAPGNGTRLLFTFPLPGEQA